MEYDCIVIGAGIGGLSAALKLSSAGKRVLVLEKQPIPGGFATTFSRKGFLFESALHCVDNLGETGSVRKFLEECQVAQKLEFIPLNNFMRLIYPQQDFVVDFNPDNFIQSLKGNFPYESKQIDLFFARVNKFSDCFDIFCACNLPFWLKALSHPLVTLEMIKVSRLTAEELVFSYTKDIKLKALLTDIWRFIGLPASQISAFYFLLVFYGYYYNSTDYVKGGFGRLFRAMVEKIEETGSEVRFNSTASKIITAGGQAYKAVITDKGDAFKARVVIANANPFEVLTKLIDNQDLKQEYRYKLSTFKKSISAFHVFLGLKVPAKDLGMDHFMFSINTSYNHEKNYEYSLSGDYERCSLAIVDHAQIDPGTAPQGKGNLLIMTLDNYQNWQNLGAKEYAQKKKEVTDKLIRRVEKYLPNLSQYIEVVEAATPRTMERYGSSPEGAIYGFDQIIDQSGIMRFPQTTKVKGLFLAGAWTSPGGGAHACVVSGIEAANLALKYLKK